MKIKDLVTGQIFEYGSNCHHSLRISQDGRTLSFENLQNGDGSKYGEYRFIDDNEEKTPDEIESEYSSECYFNIGGFAEEYNNGFCEWKLDGVYLLCQHNTELVISCLEEEKYRYTYCPYCGKKIKVVEE